MDVEGIKLLFCSVLYITDKAEQKVDEQAKTEEYKTARLLYCISWLLYALKFIIKLLPGGYVSLYI